MPMRDARVVVVVGSLVALLGCERQPADAPLAQETRATGRQVTRTIEVAGQAIDQHTRSAAHEIERGAAELVDAGRAIVHRVEHEDAR